MQDSKHKNIVIRQIIERIILWSIYSIPFVCFRETLLNFDLSIPERLIPYFKFPKYLFGLALFTLGLLVWNWRKLPIANSILIVTLFSSVCLGIILQIHNFYILIGGLMWAFPLFLCIFFIGNISYKFIKQLKIALTLISVLNVIILILEIISANFWDSIIKKGLTARPPGLFLIPSESALLHILCLFIWTWGTNSPKDNYYKYVFALNVLGIILCTSFAGILALFILFLVPYIINIVVGRKWKIAVSLLLIFTIVGFYLNDLTGRNRDGIQISVLKRIQIFKGHFSIKNYIPNYFGEASNFTKSLANQYKLVNQHNTFIADSLFTSIYFNLGWIAFLIIFISSLWYLLRHFNSKNLPQINLTLIILIFGSALILTECYPFNYILAAMIGFYFSKRKKILLNN